MLTKCWEGFNGDMLAPYGACDCRDQCKIKAELVDLLIDVLEHDGPEIAQAAGRFVVQGVPRFKWL